MNVSLTDEIIDAILQNERGLQARGSRAPRPVLPPGVSGQLADPKPDLGPFLPGIQAPGH